MASLYSIVHDLNTLASADHAADYLVIEDVSTGLLKRILPNNLLSGYQPIDADLTTIGGLTPSNDHILQRKSGAWTNRTMAQLLTDLVAAGAIDNTNIQTIGGAKTFSAAAAFSSTVAITGAMSAAARITAAKGIQCTPTALTYAATISLDCSLSDVFTLTLAGSPTINATGLQAGQRICLILTTRTTADVVTFNTNFRSAGTFTAATTGNKKVVIEFVSDGTSLIERRRTGEL